MRNFIALFSAAALLSAAPPPDFHTEGTEWWSYVKTLSSDDMQGRLTGSEGYRKAAAYVTAQFQKDGLQPKGTDGFLQPVPFDVQRIQASQSSVTLLQNGTEHPIRLNEDALLGSRLPQPKHIEASLVFVGYGLHVPSANYDDLAGQDLHGNHRLPRRRSIATLKRPEGTLARSPGVL